MLILRGPAGQVRKIVFCSTGTALVAAIDNGIAFFRTLDRSKPQKIDQYCYADMEIADADRTLFLPEHGGLRSIDLATGAVRKFRLATTRMARIAGTRDARQFVIGQPSDPKNLGYVSLRSCSDPASPVWHQALDRSWIKRVLLHEGRDEVHCMVQNGHPFPTEFWFETFSLSTGKEIRRSDLLAEEHDDDGVLSPDGEWLATFRMTRISVYPTSTAFTQPTIVKNTGRPSYTSIAYHPSGRFLAATSNDTTVKLYDTATWQLARTYSWNIGRLRSIAFSPDGLLAAAGSDTGRIMVWDVDE
ncbi:MAG: WD40 repeat domain-containing protein [Gemmataceae bacterium]